MVTELATDAGLEADQLYFNIENVGNVSAASIPIAIHDAVAEGVIDRPMRVFAPGFGAGAVGGYAVLTIDPSVVARADANGGANGDRAAAADPATAGSSPDDVWTAFGA
jgi:3-oxoacyl-[acyl-carrier-protein] synthase III